jgi:hypothetical protein
MTNKSRDYYFLESDKPDPVVCALRRMWREGYNEGYNDAHHGRQHVLLRRRQKLKPFRGNPRKHGLCRLLLNEITRRPWQLSTRQIREWIRTGTSSFANNPNLGRLVDSALHRLRRYQNLIVNIDGTWHPVIMPSSDALAATIAADGQTPPAESAASGLRRPARRSKSRR